MKEIEIKLPVDMDTFQRVGALVVNKKNDEYTTDTYFDTHGRGTLRVRSIERSGHATRFVTVKGPKTVGSNGITSRDEMELQIYAMAEQWSQAFEMLGFSKLAQVTKYRYSFSPIAGVTVCMDNVQDVGLFVEIEVVSNNEQEAWERITLVRTLLGLDGIEPETRGYLDMVLEAKAQT